MFSACLADKNPMIVNKDQRSPSQTPSSRLDVSLRRHYVDEFHRNQFARIPTNARIADLGGHRDKKRGSFDIRAYQGEVVCVNITSEHGADIVADAADLPCEDASFDVVVCSELLEHVRSPVDVLREAIRILKPGGRLIACSPFLYHIHADPDDYGRYTDRYWQVVLAELGFVEIHTEAQGRFWSVLVDMIRHVTNRWDQSRKSRLKILRAVVHRGLSWAKSTAVRWDSALLPAGCALAGFTTGFGMSAVKPWATALEGSAELQIVDLSRGEGE